MSTQAPPLAGRKEWLGLAVLALPTLLLALDMSVLYLALPQISADLGADSTQQLWMIDIYGFLIAGFLITMGNLGDRIGRRKLLMIGGSAFAITSVIAAYAPSAEALIASRAALGIAGATLMPSTLALISNMFRNAKQRGTAIGIWVSCFMIGASVGPLIGGLLLEQFWWGSVFLLGVPVMVVLLVTGPVLLPEFRNADAGRLDFTSVALSLGAILPVIYGIKELAKDGIAVTPIATILVGVALGAVFLRRQRLLPDPLLDVRLFANRAFSASLLSMLLALMAFGAVMLFAIQYLQLVHGLSPFQAAVAQLPGVFAMMIGTATSAAVAQRVRPSYVIGGGLALAAVGLLIVTQVTTGSGLVMLLTGVALAGVGVSPLMALGTDLVVGSAEPEKAGAAASMSETGTEVGMALGIAIFGAVGTAVYRGQIGDSVPAGLPADAAAVASDTLAGAATVAAQLPAEVGTQLVADAQQAFVAGLTSVAGLGAVLMFGVALLALRLLRHVPPTGAVPATSAGGDDEPAEWQLPGSCQKVPTAEPVDAEPVDAEPAEAEPAERRRVPAGV